VDLGVVHVEVIVPSRGEGRWTKSPVYVVGKSDLVLGVLIQHSGVVHAATLRLAIFQHLGVAQRVGIHQHAHDPEIVRARLVVVDDDVVVVVELRALVANLPQREAGTIKCLLCVGVQERLRCWQSVYQPVQVVALVDALIHKHSILWLVCRLTQRFARLILAHAQFEWTCLYPVAKYYAPQTFADFSGPTFWLAEVEGLVVVVEGEDRAELRVALRIGGCKVIYV